MQFSFIDRCPFVVKKDACFYIHTYVSLSLPFILGNALKIVESASWGRQMCHLNLTQSPTSLIDGACFLAPSIKSRQLINFCYFFYILENVNACICLYPVNFFICSLNV